VLEEHVAEAVMLHRHDDRRARPGRPTRERLRIEAAGRVDRVREFRRRRVVRVDGTFFLRDGVLPTPLELARRTMDWTHEKKLAPQTFFGTTEGGAQRLDPLPGHLGIDKDLLKTRRAGNYAKGEFYASRVSIRRRTRAFYAQALETVREDAKCADRYVNCSGAARRTFCGGKGERTVLPEPFADFNAGERACPVGNAASSARRHHRRDVCAMAWK